MLGGDGFFLYENLALFGTADAGFTPAAMATTIR
jgi:hypothetical protein